MSLRHLTGLCLWRQAPIERSSYSLSHKIPSNLDQRFA